jgi:PIN domain nuclease of toxin-antitoxin system
MSQYVLDASALLAYLHDEEGAAEVETLSKFTERGAKADRLAADLEEQGLLHGLLEVAPLTADDALAIAELRPLTKGLGLSLGDRACLALGLRLGLPVLTADRDWVHLDNVEVDVRPIRP